MKSQAVAPILGSEVQDLIDESLHKVQAGEFVLSVYFGRNMAQRHERLASALFRMFPCPYMQGMFSRNDKTGRWRLESLKALALGLPDPLDAARRPACASGRKVLCYTLVQ